MLTLCLLVGAATAAVTSRRGVPRDWSELVEKRVDANQKVAFRLALPQRNVAQLAAETIERATPSSAKYGQWFTNDEVLDLIAPGAWSVERGARLGRRRAKRANKQQQRIRARSIFFVTAQRTRGAPHGRAIGGRHGGELGALARPDGRRLATRHCAGRGHGGAGATIGGDDARRRRSRAARRVAADGAGRLGGGGGGGGGRDGRAG